ncbi:unnamed protein product [Prunus armeniaca]|uniref:Uncharacterized protein n=1 Tax=Prunus armeniaca TaxID=36596 RepID=A0A6J5UCG4_PRUAR|nr:unnamed protein product [Prunus armeniaca]
MPPGERFFEELLIVSHTQKLLELPDCFNESTSHLKFSASIARCIFLGEKKVLHKTLYWLASL